MLLAPHLLIALAILLVFSDAFRLKHRADSATVHVATLHRGRATDLAKDRARVYKKPSDLGLNLPSELTSKWDNVKEVGMGSFGAVWQGTAKEGSCTGCKDGVVYAIKVFYKKESNGVGSFVSWKSSRYDAETKFQLKAASQECDLAKNIADTQGRMDSRSDLIAKCVSNHVSRDTACSGGGFCDSILYLVLDNGGTGIDTYWPKNARSRSIDDLKSVIKQSLNALDFLKRQGYLHHDLKSENMVLREEDNMLKVKFIDWGAAVEANSTWHDPLASNSNAPPEWDFRYGFDTSYPYAYDVFTIGHVIIELLAGAPLFDMYKELELDLENPPTYKVKSWCSKEGFPMKTTEDQETCNFWYGLDQFWKWLRTPVSYRSIAALVERWAQTGGAPQKLLRVKTAFYDQLKDDETFQNFLDQVGRMLLHSARKRPSAADIMKHPWLAGVYDGGASAAIDKAQGVKVVKLPPQTPQLDVKSPVKTKPSVKVEHKFPSGDNDQDIRLEFENTCRYRSKSFTAEMMCARLANSPDVPCEEQYFGDVFRGDCVGLCAEVKDDCVDSQYVKPSVSSEVFVADHNASQKKPSQSTIPDDTCTFRGEPYSVDAMCSKIFNSGRIDCRRVFFNHLFKGDCNSFCEQVAGECVDDDVDEPTTNTIEQLPKCLFKGELFPKESMCARLKNLDQSCAQHRWSSAWKGDCDEFCRQVEPTC